MSLVPEMPRSQELPGDTRTAPARPDPAWIVCVAWVLSVGALALPALTGGAVDPGAASPLGLALLPWLALAGMPRGGSASTFLVLPLLALPSLVLGAALGGQAAPAGDLGGLVLPLACGVLLLALLSFSAVRGGWLQAAAWSALVVLPPALAAAFALTGNDGVGGVPGPVAFLARNGPLGWAWSVAAGGPGGLSPGRAAPDLAANLIGGGVPWTALGLAAALVLAAEFPHLLARRPGPGNTPPGNTPTGNTPTGDATSAGGEDRP